MQVHIYQEPDSVLSGFCLHINTTYDTPWFECFFANIMYGMRRSCRKSGSLWKACKNGLSPICNYKKPFELFSV